MTPWTAEELAGSQFPDARLNRRFKLLIERLSEGIGETIPMACQDWANTKAAYRFLSNERVNEADILAGHFACTRERFLATEGPILVLHDTTAFAFQRDKPELIGATGITRGGKTKAGQRTPVTVCGLLMHSSLVVTPDGLPLGLSAVKFWNRKKFKGANALKKKINPTRVPIEEKESIRWLENLRQTTTESTRQMRSHWRSGKRYLRVVLYR
jgi:hypothetical protein